MSKLQPIKAEELYLSRFTVEYLPVSGNDKYNTTVTIVVSIDGHLFTSTKNMWLIEVSDYLSGFGVSDL